MSDLKIPKRRDDNDAETKDLQLLLSLMNKAKTFRDDVTAWIYRLNDKSYEEKKKEKNTQEAIKEIKDRTIETEKVKPPKEYNVFREWEDFPSTAYVANIDTTNKVMWRKLQYRLPPERTICYEKTATVSYEVPDVTPYSQTRSYGETRIDYTYNTPAIRVHQSGNWTIRGLKKRTIRCNYTITRTIKDDVEKYHLSGYVCPFWEILKECKHVFYAMIQEKLDYDEAAGNITSEDNRNIRVALSSDWANIGLDDFDNMDPVWVFEHFIDGITFEGGLLIHLSASTLGLTQFLAAMRQVTFYTVFDLPRDFFYAVNMLSLCVNPDGEEVFSSSFVEGVFFGSPQEETEYLKKGLYKAIDHYNGGTVLVFLPTIDKNGSRMQQSIDFDIYVKKVPDIWRASCANDFEYYGGFIFNQSDDNAQRLMWARSEKGAIMSNLYLRAFLYYYRLLLWLVNHDAEQELIDECYAWRNFYQEEYNTITYYRTDAALCVIGVSGELVQWFIKHSYISGDAGDYYIVLDEKTAGSPFRKFLDRCPEARAYVPEEYGGNAEVWDNDQLAPYYYEYFLEHFSVTYLARMIDAYYREQVLSYWEWDEEDEQGGHWVVPPSDPTEVQKIRDLFVKFYPITTALLQEND